MMRCDSLTYQEVKRCYLVAFDDMRCQVIISPWFRLAALGEERSLNAVDIRRDPHPRSWSSHFLHNRLTLTYVSPIPTFSSEAFFSLLTPEWSPFSSTTFQLRTFSGKALSENAKSKEVFCVPQKMTDQAFSGVAHFLTMRPVPDQSFCVSKRWAHQSQILWMHNFSQFAVFTFFLDCWVTVEMFRGCKASLSDAARLLHCFAIAESASGIDCHIVASV